MIYTNATGITCLCGNSTILIIKVSADKKNYQRIMQFAYFEEEKCWYLQSRLRHFQIELVHARRNIRMGGAKHPLSLLSALE